jgi:hypothetical protein
VKRTKPGPAEDRYRMRRLTDAEMTELTRLARDGPTGPARAIDALWELIVRDAHGVSLAEAAERGFHVQDYAMAGDQAKALKNAMVERRRLPRKVVEGFWLTWAMYSPADYEPVGDEC